MTLGVGRKGAKTQVWWLFMRMYGFVTSLGGVGGAVRRGVRVCAKDGGENGVAGRQEGAARLERPAVVDVENRGSEVELVEEEVEKKSGGFDILGLEPSPELAAILLVYFAQGAMGISRLAVSFFYKDALGLSPTEAAALGGIGMIPWLIKPLYGFLSDSVPLFGLKRRSYLVASGFLGAGAWTALGTAVTLPWQAVTAAFLTSISVAFSDVVADSLVVERVRGKAQSEAGKLQSLCWGSAAIGGLLSAYFSGSLLEQFTPATLFRMTAIIPLLTASIAFAIREEPVKEPTTIQRIPSQLVDQTKRLWNALKEKSVWMPALFVFIFQASPSPDTALFYFTTNELHFNPEFLGRVRLLASAASLVGVGLYQKFLKEIPVKNVLVGTLLVSVPLGLTQLILVTHLNRELGIPDQVFSLADTAVLTVLGQMAFMPTLVLAARICPPGVEGTLFAALMSIYNASGVVSTQLGALLTRLLGITESNFDNLALLIWICNLSALSALPFVPLINAAAKPEADNE